ncbi:MULTISPECIES: restriction endonuclease [unclassified Pseudoxanthomonas]|jgi:hypothetical protein|uniref:restriction endonuclease n=1 Tax=unclassified Pseudoxanthomonas TaxID=2645906 RepID=UPI0030779C7E
MPVWLPGLAVTLLIGTAATAYLWLIRRRNDEMAAGLHALSGLRWREFSRLVLDAMALRGLIEVVPDGQGSREPQSTFVLNRDGKRWLLSCKHGSAYRIAAAPVVELAAGVRLSSAAGGILATEGRVEKEGREAAQGNNIEVLDGPRLWPEVKPLIETSLRDEIVSFASARAKRHIGISWLAAFAAGALVTVAVVNYLATNRPAAPIASTPAPAAPAANTGAVTVAPYPTDEELADQRAKVLLNINQTPGLARGFWQTSLTLSVDRIATEQEVWPLICKEVERFPALRNVRIQLNPPPGSDEPVRWRQCKTM